jgi:hypothetical protein
MRRRHHHRMSAYQNTKPRNRSTARTTVGVIVIAIVLFYLGRGVLSFFGSGNRITRTGTTVTVEDGGIASVSIGGDEQKRAEQGQKLYPGDRIITSGASNVRLNFFEKTIIRMDEMTDLHVAETVKGEEESEISVGMQEGTIWVKTPDLKSFSGSINRIISTPILTALLPSGTEALISARSIVVYSADGIGVTVETKGGVVPLIVGEGQKFTMPPNATKETNLYDFRSALDPLAVKAPLVEEARRILVSGIKDDGSEDNSEDVDDSENPIGEVLAVLSPKEDETTALSTVTVSGRVGETVDRVRINGYSTTVEDGTYSQELALPNSDEVNITVLALGKNGETLKEIHRKITRDRTPPKSPSILLPASAGQIYRTNEERLEISGEAPAGTVGIQVNDYRLQLFESGNKTWSYLASTKINNYHPGTNVFKVFAINKGGYKSDPAEITILLENGPVGIVNPDEESAEEPNIVEGTSSSASSVVTQLPNNDPLKPGSVTVIAPTNGETYETAEVSFLIEGNTSADTHSFWINGYRLRLYEPGKITWNYIADINMNTLHRGTNTYLIEARDSNNMLLDRKTYTVEFTAR